MNVERGQCLNEIICVNFCLIFFSGSARNFGISLKNADKIPVDVSDTIEMELPDYADTKRLKK